MLTFANPFWLFLLILIPIVGWWYWKRHGQHYAPIRFSNLQSLQGMSSWRGRYRTLLPILRALAFCSLVLAIARPQQLLQNENIAAEGIDMFISMDISTSMLAEDFEPNRLAVGKRMAVEFVEKRPYDRLGLVVFAGETYTQCPLTADHRVLKQYLEGISCGYLEKGTAIGMGLAMAVNRLKESTAKSKVIILLTDGMNNSGYISPETAIELAKAYNIRVYTVGIGSVGEAKTPIDVRGDGSYVYGLVPVEIDETLMQRIAKETGGEYNRATSAEALAKIYTKIDLLEKSKYDVTTIRNKKDIFGYFVVFALALLVLELCLRYTIFRTIP